MSGKDLTDVSDRRKYVAECIELIKSVESEALKEELIEKVSEQSGISYQSLKRDIESGEVKSSLKEESKIEIKQNIKCDGVSVAERFILWAVVNKKDYVSNYPVEELIFSDEHRDKIAEGIFYQGVDDMTELYSLVGEAGVEELGAILSSNNSYTTYRRWYRPLRNGLCRSNFCCAIYFNERNKRITC